MYKLSIFHEERSDGTLIKAQHESFQKLQSSNLLI